MVKVGVAYSILERRHTEDTGEKGETSQLRWEQDRLHWVGEQVLTFGKAIDEV